ncbi:autotransporter outer membrane beta-barrel domain-containing protein [Pasteurella dagmatis]|nr:autotransporter outer membrane beta-barrel domain-containing protein [Pasteurella dagmatis]SNV84094.1 protein YdeU [Pasteurella dagmatis]
MKIRYATLPLASLIFLYSNYSISNMQTINECRNGCSTVNNTLDTLKSDLNNSHNGNSLANTSLLAANVVDMQLPELNRLTMSSLLKETMGSVNLGIDKLLTPSANQVINNKKVSKTPDNISERPRSAFRRAAANNTNTLDKENVVTADASPIVANVNNILSAAETSLEVIPSPLAEVAVANEVSENPEVVPQPMPIPKPEKPKAPEMPKVIEPRYNAAMASYASNLYAANNMFSITLSERLGITNFYRQHDLPGIWIKATKGRAHHKMSNGSTHLSSKNYSIVLGEDREVNYTSKVGYILGYAQQTSTISADKDSASAKVKGYSVGAYYAWQKDDSSKSGLFVNSWLQYQWFKNEINSPESKANYTSKGFTASVETGYHLPLTEYRVDSLERHRISVQPQMQITWQGVKPKNYIDSAGTTFVGFGHGNIQTKIGTKLLLDSHVSRSKINIKPYVEINLVHNSKDFGTYVNGRRKAIEGTKRFVEYNTGIEAKVGPNMQMWATVGQRRSKQAYKETQVQVGFKVTF